MLVIPTGISSGVLFVDATFESSRDAKEFLAGRIFNEAQREGISISDIERKMLYFSETAWTLPDMMATNDVFDREYDREEYEQKIASLSRKFVAHASKNSPDELTSWKEAIRTLRQEDHYILVLVASEKRPSILSGTSLVRLLLFELVLAVLALTAGYFLAGR